MRKDGRAYGDDGGDPDPTPLWWIGFVVFMAVLAWLVAGAPGWR